MELLTEEKIDIQAILQRSDAVIAQAEKFLHLDGKDYMLGEWVTIKRYADMFNLDTHVVTNWIKRGIISPENMKEVEDLNGIRLVRAIAYK